MKKIILALIGIIFIAMASCASGPKPQDTILDPPPEQSAEQAETNDDLEGSDSPPDEIIPEDIGWADSSVAVSSVADSSETKISVIPDKEPEPAVQHDIIKPEPALVLAEKQAPQTGKIEPRNLPEPAFNLSQPQSAAVPEETIPKILPEPEAKPPVQITQVPAAPPAPSPPAPPAPVRTPAPAPAAPLPLPVLPASEPEPPPPPLPAEARTLPETSSEEIIFSRIVRATPGQLVEIPFRGTGWVYLGELRSQRGIGYNSRRMDSEGQSFIFQIDAAGSYVLKFYKQDFLRDYILNDHVQVIAAAMPEAGGAGWFNPPVDRSRVIAEPRWPSSPEEAEITRSNSRPQPREPSVTDAVASTQNAGQMPAAEQQRPAGQQQAAAPPAVQAASGQNVQAEQPRSNPQAAASPEKTEAAAVAFNSNTAPDVFLQQARQEFEAGKPAAALAILNQFMGYYPAGSDEAYWLYGQLYEANSPSRNILTALDYYRRLTSEYPQSSRFAEARRRISYLERFYINIQ